MTVGSRGLLAVERKCGAARAVSSATVDDTF